MKVLIVAPYASNKFHFETDLELAQCHLDAGDQVTLLGCNAQLAACDINIDHQPETCLHCWSRRCTGVRQLKKPIEVLPYIRLSSEDRLAIADARTTFSDLDDLRTYRFRSFDVGYAVLSSLVSQFRNPSPSLIRQSDRLSRLMVASLSVYLSVGRLLDTRDFDRAYVFNGRYAPLRGVLRACQERAVDCFLHDRGSVLEKFALFENALPHDIKKAEERIQLAWESAVDPSERHQVAGRFFKERASGITKNWFSFVDQQIKGLLPESWNPDHHNVVIYTSSEDEMVAIGDEWRNPIYRDQINGLERIVEDARRHPHLSLYIRVHPNLRGQTTDDLKRVMALHGNGVEVIPADSNVNSYALLRAADAVLTFGSTIGIEGAYWGTPSILAGNCFYRRLGSTHNPKNHRELIDLLIGPLDSLDRLGAIKYGYWAATFGVEFRHYQPTGIFQGLFRGASVGPGAIAKIVVGFLRSPVGWPLRQIIRWFSLSRLMAWMPKER